MDWRMDGRGLLCRVSPFRYLRINGYLLLPEAFRSLLRLSSALSAKASTLRSLLLDHHKECSVNPYGSRFVFKSFLSSIKSITVSRDVLGCLFPISLAYDVYQLSWQLHTGYTICGFQGTYFSACTRPRKLRCRGAMYIAYALYSYIHHYLTAWAVIRIRNSFQTLITGQASYSNSTSLLIQVSISSSQIQCLFYFEHPWSLTCGDFLFVIPAATCFPISSPI